MRATSLFECVSVWVERDKVGAPCNHSFAPPGNWFHLMGGKGRGPALHSVQAKRKGLLEKIYFPHCTVSQPSKMQGEK